MSEWTDADVEAGAGIVVRTWYAAAGWDPDEIDSDSFASSLPAGRAVARALLASGAVVPARVVEEAERKLFETQEHIAYHLRDFRPTADMAATGDLAVDMGAFADRMKSRAERAELALTALREAGTLDPAENVALTVAWHQVERGDEPTPSCAAVCVVALERIRRALLTEGRDRAGEGAS